GRFQPFGIVGMRVQSDPSPPPVIDTRAEIRERHAVRIHALTLRPEYGDQLWGEVQHLAEFELLFLHLPFGFFELFDLKMYPNPAENGAILCSERFRATDEPAVNSLGVNDSQADLAGATRAQAGRPDSTALFVIIRMHRGKN